MNSIQFEAVVWAMFRLENDIDQLSNEIPTIKNEQLRTHAEKTKEKYIEHFKAFKAMVEDGVKNY